MNTAAHGVRTYVDRQPATMRGDEVVGGEGAAERTHRVDEMQRKNSPELQCKAGPTGRVSG